MSIANNIAQRLGFVPAGEVEEMNSKYSELNSQLKAMQETLATLDSERSFSGAQQNHLTTDWTEIYDTINGSLYKGLRELRARSRWLSQNDPWAKKFLKMLKKNVVGPDGFILRNNATELVKQADGSWKRQYDKVANMIIQEAWEDWCLPENCGVTEQLAFQEMTKIILGQMASDGDILVKPVRDVNYKYGYKLQLIKSDVLDDAKNGYLPNSGNFVVLGVELTPYLKPVAYWVKKADPFMSTLYGVDYVGDSTRIPMYDANGMIQLKLLFVQEVSDQVRGVPWFAPTIIRLKMLTGYEEAVLIDARISASKNLIYEYKDGSAGDAITEANLGNGVYAKTDTNGKKDPSVLVQPNIPGNNVIVPNGMTAKIADFKSPSGREGEFQKHALRGIASGLDVSFIGLANNYEAVNYTSSRTNLLEERDTWKDLHAWTRNHFLNWNFGQFLFMALNLQAIPLPVSKYQKFNKPWFQGRAWKWVSPKDEAEAILLMLSNDAWLFEEFLAENGWSMEEWIEKKKAEVERFKDAGLPYPGSNYKQAAPAPKEPEPEPKKNGKAVVVQN